MEQIESIPEHAVERKTLIIASSDTTSHRHRIKDRGSAVLFSAARRMYLEVVEETAELVHPEHDTIVLTRGYYRVWHQREYGDIEPRTVMD